MVQILTRQMGSRKFIWISAPPLHHRQQQHRRKLWSCVNGNYDLKILCLVYPWCGRTSIFQILHLLYLYNGRVKYPARLVKNFMVRSPTPFSSLNTLTLGHKFTSWCFETTIKTKNGSSVSQTRLEPTLLLPSSTGAQPFAFLMV